MIPSIIRTAVPYVVGWLVGLLVLAGIDVPTEVQAWADETLTLVLGTAYYAAARWLETRGLTWPLLGSRQQPTYVGEHRAD